MLNFDGIDFNVLDNDSSRANNSLKNEIKNIINGINVINNCTNEMNDMMGVENSDGLSPSDVGYRLQGRMNAWCLGVNETLGAMCKAIQKMDEIHSHTVGSEEIGGMIQEKIEKVNLTQNKFEYHCDSVLKTIDERVKTLEENGREVGENLRSDYSKLNELESQIKANSQRINGIQERVEGGLSGPQNSTFLGTSIIQHNIEAKPPVFSDLPTDKPMIFLNELKAFVDLNRTDSGLDLRFRLKNCFEGEARNWWYMVQNEITSWESFEKEFKSTYWNPIVQANLKHKIEFGKYYQSNGLTRVQYAIHVFTLGNDLRILEDEVCMHLRNHFPRDVSVALIHLENRAQILKTLSKFDSDEKIARERQARIDNQRGGSRDQQNNRQNNNNYNNNNYNNNRNNNNENVCGSQVRNNGNNSNRQNSTVNNNNNVGNNNARGNKNHNRSQNNNQNARVPINLVDFNEIETIAEVHEVFDQGNE